MSNNEFGNAFASALSKGMANAGARGQNELQNQLTRQRIEQVSINNTAFKNEKMRQANFRQSISNAVDTGDWGDIYKNFADMTPQIAKVQQMQKTIKDNKTADPALSALRAINGGNIKMSLTMLNKNKKNFENVDGYDHDEMVALAVQNPEQYKKELRTIAQVGGKGNILREMDLGNAQVSTQQATTKWKLAQTAKELSKGVSKRLLVNKDSGLFEFQKNANPSNDDQIKVDTRNQKKLENYTKKQEKHQVTLDKNNNMIAIVEALKEPKMKKGLEEYLAWSLNRIPGQEDTTFLAEGSDAFKASVLVKRLGEMNGIEQVVQAIMGGMESRMTATEVENLKKTGLTFPAGYNYKQMVNNLDKAYRKAKRNKSDVMKKNRKLPKNYMAIDRVSTFTDPDAKDVVLTKENTGTKSIKIDAGTHAAAIKHLQDRMQ